MPRRANHYGGKRFTLVTALPDATEAAPETAIGDEALAETIKIPVPEWRDLYRHLRGRPNRPPVAKLPNGTLVANKRELIAWWGNLRRPRGRDAARH